MLRLKLGTKFATLFTLPLTNIAVLGTHPIGKYASSTTEA